MNGDTNLNSYHLVSLGCARNQVDSEGMAGQLAEAGWQETDDPSRATLIVINTCSFISSAADESIDTILAMAAFKREGRCRRLIVTGCLPERYGKAILPEMPEVDVFLGTGAFGDIVAVAQEVSERICHLPDPDYIVGRQGNGPRRLTDAHTAYLKIAEGCSRHCTYCIIPRLRGRQKSRPPEEILTEAASLVTAGVRELVLVAQDTTAYGQDLASGERLTSLLGQLAEVDAHTWIRMLYGHPLSLDPALLQTVRQYDNLLPYFDIPIQHAADTILSKMGRQHRGDHLRRLFDTIRRTVPDAVLRTTAIVGFPGETEADFNQLLDLVREVRFDHLGTFIYSDSEDLPSHRLPDPVATKTAALRHDRLMECQAEIAEAANRRYRDSVLTVLVEEQQEPALYTGRAWFQAPEVDGLVFVRGSDLETGSFCRVRITDTLEYDLVGDVDV